MKKQGNICVVLLVALVTVCTGAALFINVSESRYNSRTEYERIKNRYIAESGIDIAVGTFLNYLSNQRYVLSYDKFGITYAPYLLNEIAYTSDEYVSMEQISNETRDYLISIGYINFRTTGSISLKLNTFYTPESFKLNELCIEPDFLINIGADCEKSKIKPIYLTAESEYNGGELMCNIKLSDICLVRNAFSDETGSVEAWLDTSEAVITYENYQNYGGT